MKPSWAKQEVYDYFDQFIQISILGNDSYITQNPGIFTTAHLDACVAAFVDNPPTDDGNFDTKSREQFALASVEVKEVFAHFIWLWSLSSSEMWASGKKSAVIRFLGETYANRLKDVFVDAGVGSTGQRHKLKKPFEISYLLLLFREVKNRLGELDITDVPGVKRQIENLCRELYYNNEETKASGDPRLNKAASEDLAMHHILLHLCDPDRYEAIAAQKHKNAIISTFFSLLDKPSADGLWDDIDASIYAIRKKLDELLGYEVNFYDEGIKQAWDFEEDKNDTSEIALFEFKKAIVFYGPPGTSKTYSADRLAKWLITKQYFRNRRNIKEYFGESDAIFKRHIHRLQMHSNYSYEEFIAGVQIEDKATVVKPGYLLRLIEAVKNDPMPHVLILDEINRIDISRLFGELFSAIEYRDTTIELSVGNLAITLPENIYFIGTMNEIDFSLERVDFALRRRFLWVMKGFESGVLVTMIREKKDQLKMKIEDSDIERYAGRCSRLNNELSAMPELGKNYQIGHTFFAEAVALFRAIKQVRSGRIYFLDQPIRMLWEISIKPIIEAFLGNMDTDSKDQRVAQLEKIFLND
jgi:5-methylcytosine-specific restriction protein B